MIDVRLVTDAVIAFCKLRLAGTNIAVGDGKAPDGFGAGYVVVYRIAAGVGESDRLVGSFAQPDDMAQVKYQFSAVGASRAQAEAIQVRLTSPFVELAPAGGYLFPLTVAGHTVVSRKLSTDIGVGSEGSFTSVRHVALLVAAA